jgi:fumarate reductase (CoM/CoB) subunit A
VETINTDVLIVGAGAAGIRAALAASEAGADVAMVAKGEVAQAGSTFSTISQGWGIQALVGKERTQKNLEAFYDDIMRVGLGQCDPKLVRILVEEAGPRFEDLISYGIRFRKDSYGDYVRAKGCFSECKRAFLTEDFANLQASFLSILRRSAMRVVRGYVIDLMTGDGACWGAWTVTPAGKVGQIKAKATVLATGGGAGIFKDHMVSEGEIGEGYALAYGAGAELNNLEFIQFMLGLKMNGLRHFLPLADLPKPGMLRSLEGYDLLQACIPDPKTRARVVNDRQSHFPFSCRDASHHIDIAVAKEHQQGRGVAWGGGGGMQDRGQVVHFAHAFNGGVKINERAESTIPGLFATGEVAAGPHGADRIGGCMMTATQVFGARAGRFAADYASKTKSVPEIGKWPNSFQKHKGLGDKKKSLYIIKDTATGIYRNYLMILRDDNGLRQCLHCIRDLEVELGESGWNHPEDLIPYSAVKTMLIVGTLIAEGGLRRDFSLGSHFRTDAPNHPQKTKDMLNRESERIPRSLTSTSSVESLQG